MDYHLALPYFWSEARDPWSWQRVLKHLASLDKVPEWRPCWTKHCQSLEKRRGIAGLYGLKKMKTKVEVRGVGLLEQDDLGWKLSNRAKELLDLDRDEYQKKLAEILLRQSAWLRLALLNIQSKQWHFPNGANVLLQKNSISIGVDLMIPSSSLNKLSNAKQILGELPVCSSKEPTSIQNNARLNELSVLHRPLYLLLALGWLNNAGDLKLPSSVSVLGLQEDPVVLLQVLTRDTSDVLGFVSVHAMAIALSQRLNLSLQAPDIWFDQVLYRAIQKGSIEIQAWAPGQPRHGRGYLGEKKKQLVKWIIHSDFEIPKGVS